MIGASAISTPAANFSISSRTKLPSLYLCFHRRNSVVSALPRPYSDSSTSGLSLRIDEKGSLDAKQSYVTVKAKGGNPPIMPAVMTPGGPLDLSSVLFRNRIIFIGQPINSQVAQRVISQLVTLATIDEKTDILMYLNCPGGSTYSVLAIYDCMSWIKPKVGTVCFGVAASQGALLLAGGEKGMRYAMPNARIMIHQPQGGCGGHVEDVRRQVNEAVQARHKIDQMYAVFTGQPLEKVQQYTREIVSYPLQRLWSLGSLMASWKQNIKPGSIRTTTTIIECSVEVGYIFGVKMSCLRFSWDLCSNVFKEVLEISMPNVQGF